MNIDLKDIPAKIIPVLEKLREYVVFISILAVLGLFGFIVIQVRSVANIEPSQAQVMEKLNELNPPRVDQDAIDKIQQLEDANIEVKTLFEEARDNPFQD